ncbi:hypothetical protein [Kineococcus sp. SYSU DK005]|uniref:hypothetical protein n=1 Tax=Kineococcus sp. SYSU DK005 TaxID=3383126 RepID=UPI003D7C4EDB
MSGEYELDLHEEAEALTASLRQHAATLATWPDVEQQALQAATVQLRRAFQRYEDAAGERTGTLLDLDHVDDEDVDDEQEHVADSLAAAQDAGARLISVFSRFDYLHAGERAYAEDLTGAIPVAGIQVSLEPSQPLPIDDAAQWPPEDELHWLTPQGQVLAVDVFDPGTIAPPRPGSTEQSRAARAATAAQRCQCCPVLLSTAPTRERAASCALHQGTWNYGS